jgi:cytochrome P450
MSSPQQGSVPELFDHVLLAEPHARYAQLRRAGSVHRTTTPDGAAVWLVTRYTDVRDALDDPRLSVDKRAASGAGEHGASMPPELDAHLLNLDAPDHTRLRRLVSAAFTSRHVEGLRELVQSRTDELLDQIPDARADLVAGLASPLPLTVICDLLGVPNESRHDFRVWTNTLRSPAPDSALSSRDAMRHMRAFLIRLIARKRALPDDDLLSRMIAARDDHDRLTEDELIALAFLILYLGSDNPVNLIGNALLALLTNPNELQAFRDGTVTIGQVLDETMRWNSPSMLAVRRFTLEPVEIGGTTIPAGQRIWLSLAAANRDESIFAEPSAFRPARGGPPHLGFGHGIHYCLGTALARLEGEIAITTLLRRHPAIELTQPASELTWWPSFRNRALLELPVQW